MITKFTKNISANKEILIYGDRQEVVQDTKVTIEWQQQNMTDVSPVDSSQKNGLARVRSTDKIE